MLGLQSSVPFTTSQKVYSIQIVFRGLLFLAILLRVFSDFCQLLGLWEIHWRVFVPVVGLFQTFLAASQHVRCGCRAVVLTAIIASATGSKSLTVPNMKG